jgi:polyferredoxin
MVALGIVALVLFIIEEFVPLKANVWLAVQIVESILLICLVGIAIVIMVMEPTTAHFIYIAICVIICVIKVFWYTSPSSEVDDPVG